MVATAESKPNFLLFARSCCCRLTLTRCVRLLFSRHWQDEVHHGGMAYDFGTRRVDVNLNDKADALKDLEEVLRLVVCCCFFLCVGGVGGIVQ